MTSPPAGRRARTGVLVDVVVCAGVAVGLGLSLLSWRAGVDVVALTLLLAAGLRLSLPGGSAGLLLVRSRGLDGGVLLVLGFGLLVLANTVPEG
ncbi:MAG: hypothetical protein JWN57_373 [Frankiales bacterium]|nr:hypothetical protein [Frankiales bacterium]